MGRRNRPSSIDVNRSPQMRAELANAAARLMVEQGITDLHLAKRKALRLLSLPESQPLPSNEEVQSALRDYQALFVGDEQQEHLQFLREVAVELMHLLQDFRPYLTGSVLDGTAGEYSSIDLLLFADSAKEVEIFLLNQDLSFHHGTPRDERIEAVFIIDDPDTGVSANLMVLGPEHERMAFKHRDGKTRNRARMEAVESLIGSLTHDTP
jgi:hypothetical protein